MSDPIAVALISLSGTIFGAFIHPLMTYLRERSLRPADANSGLRDLTSGPWSGYMIDVYRTDGAYGRGKEPLQVNIKKTFLSPFLAGDLLLERYNGSTGDILLERGVLRNRAVMFQFRNRDEGKRQMGTMTVFLSELGDRLTGFQAGWSPWDECYVVGKMVLVKGPRIESAAEAVKNTPLAPPKLDATGILERVELQI